MKKLLFVLLTAMTLTACQSGIGFEFSTSQDDQACLKNTPSHNCDVKKN